MNHTHIPQGLPLLLDQAHELIQTYRHVSQADIMRIMKISVTKAKETRALYEEWTTTPNVQTPAIDAFTGDIYSGLQVSLWTDEDRSYAHRHLRILSGLYGVLRACDGIMPYRLEMGYKLPDGTSLYSFWSDEIAKVLDIPASASILNLSAVEYIKAVLPFVGNQVISPRFLTKSPTTGRPTFVTVHAKIARGALARWMIQGRVSTIDEMHSFDQLNYRYDSTLSTEEAPVFVCDSFGGLGLSVRTQG